MIQVKQAAIGCFENCPQSVRANSDTTWVGTEQQALLLAAKLNNLFQKKVWKQRLFINNTAPARECVWNVKFVVKRYDGHYRVYCVQQ